MPTTTNTRLATALALLTLAAAATSCTDESDTPNSTNAAAATTGQTDDTPTPPAPDVGDPRQIDRLIATFARMQRNFKARDMTAVCSNVSDLFLSQFPPNRNSSDAPCPTKLNRLARRIERDRVQPGRLDIDYTRIYSLDGFDSIGLTVTDQHDTQTRIPFEHTNGTFKLELGVLANPETTLNGKLEPRAGDKTPTSKAQGMP